MLKQLWLSINIIELGDCLLGDEKIKTIALMNWPNLEQLHICLVTFIKLIIGYLPLGYNV